MTNTQTNTFTNGLNFDDEVSYVPSNQYVDALDIRIINDAGNDRSSILNLEKALVSNLDAFPLDSTEKILSVGVINNVGVIVTLINNMYNRIFRFNYLNESISQVTIVLRAYLGLGVQYPDKDLPRVDMVLNYESEDNIKVYLTDGSGMIKVINITEDYGSTVQDGGQFDIIPDAALPSLTFVSLGGGSLKAGKVGYAYQLFNVRGTASVPSAITDLIHLANSDIEGNNTSQYKGIPVGETSGKSVTMSVSRITYTFDKIRIFRFLYADGIDNVLISIVGEFDVSGSNFQFTDYGSELSQITQEEFEAYTGYQFSALTIDKKDNILFAGNIQDETWDIDYDARAYSGYPVNYNGVDTISVKITGSNNGEYIFRVNTVNDIPDIPEDFDCVNPSVDPTYVPTGRSDDYAFKGYVNISGTSVPIRGGIGKNVSYEFIYADLQGSDITTDSVPSSVANGFKFLPKMHVINYFKDDENSLILLMRPERKTFLSVNRGQYSGYPKCHASVDIDYSYKNHVRDEIYRYGIVFINNKGLRSPVHWIADIRIPHGLIPGYEPHMFKYSTNDTNASGSLRQRALGIEFTVNNIPSEVSLYEIVRCKRDQLNRTVVMQCAVSNLFNYNYTNLDTGEVGGTLDTRPLLFPTMYDFNGDGFKLSAGGSFGDAAVITITEDLILKNYYLLISPEIAINQELSVLLFNSGTKIDSLYYLTSMAYTSETISNYYAMVGPGWTYTAKGNPGLILQRGGLVTMSERKLALGNPLNDQLGLPTLVGKYFMAANNYFSVVGNHGYTRNLLRIDDVIYPKIIPYNFADGVFDMNGYYDSIGNINFLNLSTSKLTLTENDATKYGPGGASIIASIPSGLQLTNDSQYLYGNDGVYQVTHPFNNSAIASVGLMNIKNNSYPYGGASYTSRKQSVYYPVNRFNKGLQYARVFGDSYLGILDHLHTSVFLLKNVTDKRLQKFGAIAYIPFETSINLWLTHGSEAGRTASSADYNRGGFIDNLMHLDIQLILNSHVQPFPYYAYNTSYSAMNYISPNTEKSQYAIDELTFSNRIMNSDAKTANEITDSWTKFRVANYLDVDSLYGQITNLKTYNNNLIYFQDNAVGIASVNERSLIQDANDLLLSLGTGGVLSRFDYITTVNGDSTLRDNSIIDTPAGLYWYDFNKNVLVRYALGIELLSKSKTVLSYFNDLKTLNTDESTIRRRNIFSTYDSKYNEVDFNINRINLSNFNIVGTVPNLTLTFNEATDSFTSFSSIDTSFALSFTDSNILVDKISGKQVILNRDNTEGSQSVVSGNSYIKYVINDNPLSTKVFDNCWFSADFKVNDTLSTGYDNSVVSVDHNTKNLVGVTLTTQDIDNREDTYRYNVPRQYDGFGNDTWGPRLRGKYLITKLELDGKNKSFKIPYITTTYRNSLV